MENDLNLPIVDSGGFDPTPYEGRQVKIKDVRRDVIDSHYIDGEYNPNQTVQQHVVVIETEPVATFKLADGSEKTINVIQRFSLQEKVNPTTGAKDIVISKNPNAKLWKFMRKMGVMTLNELKGKTVTLTTEPSKSPDDDRRFLRIVV